MSTAHTLVSWWISPFQEFAFLRRALTACFALSLSSPPIGVLLTLRRMSLVGDATSHAILPGVALGFVMAGPSVLAMSAGGLAAGLAVAVLASAASRVTLLREDANFAALYLIALAVGVLLVSTHGTQTDLMHMLFGTVLAVDRQGLLSIAAISTATLTIMAIAYRALVLEAVDSQFLRIHGYSDGAYHTLFVTLVVLNLVAGFQAMGTLMAVGLMMLPAAAARAWGLHLPAMLAMACATGCIASYVGLTLSFHWDLPSGPAIVLTAGVLYAVAAMFSPQSSLLHAFRRMDAYTR